MAQSSRVSILTAAAVLATGLAACSRNDPAAELTAGEETRPVAALVVAPGEYPRAFAASRDVLRDFGFALERVDAQAGVITTQQRGTGGIVTPWDSMQSTFAQELEDAGQRHRRVARLEFVPLDASGAVLPGGGTGAATADLRRNSGPVEVRAWVDVYRWHQTQLRLNTISIRDSSYATDTDLEARGMTSYGVAHAQDPALAERIILALRESLGSGERVETVPAQEPAVSPVTEPPKPVVQLTPVPAAQPVTPAPEPAAPTPAATTPPPVQEPEWKKGEPLRKP